MEATPLLRPGFADPVIHAQGTFRMLLDAMSRPGSLHRLDMALEPPRRLAPATAAACLTLLDHDTPLWLDPRADDAEVWSFLRFHCGCPRAESGSAAAFAVVTGALPPLTDFAQGAHEYPDRSTTVIWQVEEVTAEGPLLLSGPGIQERASLGISPLPAGFKEAWRANRAAFPLGVDLIIAAGKTLAALPRSTRLED